MSVKPWRTKSITGTISSKKELGAIKSSGKKEAYIFDEKGNLTIHYLSSKPKNKPDTTFTFYEYNIKNENFIKNKLSCTSGYGCEFYKTKYCR